MMARSVFRNRLEWAIVASIVTLLRRLPRRASDALAHFAVGLLRRAVPRYTRIARRNLEIAFPGLSERRKRACIDGCFRNLARVIASVSKFPDIHRENVGDWIQYEGFDNVQQALELGHGVLFATAHLGNWELSAYAFGLLTAPMGVVVRPLDNPLLDALVTRYRSLSGNQVLPRRTATRGLLTLLHANRAVGILADQNTTQDRGVFVDFFGIKACVEPGLARLAAHSGAPIVPGFALWSEDDRRYKLKFFPPIYATGDALVDTQAVQSALEAVIREYPEQWLWIHRRWKSRPEGESPIY
jgi:KDO2-lipid IV(A) lauroyltransferase